MDNTIKIGCILQSRADTPKKYKVFSSKSIEVLADELFIGEADTYEEVCHIIRDYFKGADSNPYWRFCLNETATFVDYGSWSQFAAIVPPIPMSEMDAKNED